MFYSNVEPKQTITLLLQDCQPVALDLAHGVRELLVVLRRARAQTVLHLDTINELLIRAGFARRLSTLLNKLE